MTPRERVDLILAFARNLYVNGQATEQTVAAVTRLGRVLDLNITIVPRWDGLRLVANGEDDVLTAEAAAAPTGVNMDRVASAMRTIDDIASGCLASDAAKKTIDEIAQSPPSPTGLFTLAAGAGAVALAVIFGVQYIWAAILIFVSAALGAVA